MRENASYCVTSMIIRTRVKHVAKCGFLILLAASASVFIFSLYISQQESGNLDTLEDDLQYSPNSILQDSEQMLVEYFDICLFQSFTYNGDRVNASLNTLFPNFTRHQHFQESLSEQKVVRYPSFKILIEFADLMTSLNIDTVLIEPSILFCMLSPLHKDLLLKRKFDTRILNLEKAVTFGIREEYISFLGKTDVQEKIRMAHFSIEFIQEPLLEWMKIGSSEPLNSTHFTSHVFLQQNGYAVHLVVFYRRGTFLWHAALQSLSYENIPPIEELHFVQSDSAYDSLTAAFPGFTDKALTNISIPSNPQHFLFEMTTSKFLECNSSIVSSFSQFPPTTDGNTRSPVALRHFQEQAVLALQELKARFNPLLMRFWIWSGTLLGWYRQCGVIPYTSDVDFGAWASEVEDLEHVTHYFLKNKNLQLKERMGIVQQGLELNLDCHNVRVDIFFVYTESNGTWYAGHRPSKGYFFKYHHPNFTLCSAEFLGHKVLVPCETEDVLAKEYGPNWLTPVSEWNYEKSIQNRGPNIYWDKNTLKKAYS